MFQPADRPTAETVRLKGLDRKRTYAMSFEDGTHPSCVKSGAELMDEGVRVKLKGHRGLIEQLSVRHHVSFVDTDLRVHPCRDQFLRLELLPLARLTSTQHN